MIDSRICAFHSVFLYFKCKDTTFIREFQIFFVIFGKALLTVPRKFPSWEQTVPTVGTLYSQRGNILFPPWEKIRYMTIRPQKKKTRRNVGN